MRYDALEAVVLDRMILDFDGEPPRRRIEARSLGNCPAFHDTAELEPQIVMQVARGVLLNHEREGATETGNNHSAPWLGGDAEVAFAAILGEFPSDRGRCRHR